MSVRTTAALALLWALHACGGGAAPATVDVLARDVLAEESFAVVAARDDFPPSVGELCPSLSPDRDGADRLSLLLPAPAEVSLTVGDEGPCVLRAAAGIAFDAARRLPPDLPRLDVRFEVLVNGAVVFAHDAPLERVLDEAGSEWTPVAAPGGGEVVLARGDELVLRTTALRDGAPFTPPARVDAGFSHVRLVRPRPVERGPATAERPNLVLVLQDTQRADRLGVYGYARPTSPHLDRLAERGAVFEGACATSSWTWPSTASLLTGMLPAQHGVTSEASCYLDTRLAYLPQALLEAGYRTAGFSGSRLILPGKSFDRGFERFDSFRGQFRKSDELVPRATAWMREHAGERFFVYLHLVDTHAPHLPGPEAQALLAPDRPADWEPRLFQEYAQRLGRGEGRREDGALDPSLVLPPEHLRYLPELYDACVREGDRWLGELLRTLDELRLTERTVVAFTSDHGEELFDHGKLEHGHSLYRELVRVPLVLAGPGVPRGLRVAAPVSNRHLAPTLARLGGARLEGAPDPLDLLSAAGRAGERELVLSTEHGVWRDGRRSPWNALQRGELVLHVAPDERSSAAASGAQRLFDLDADPGELRDLAGLRADEADELRRHLARALEVLGTLRAHPGRSADDATLQMLGDIGYLGGEAPPQAPPNGPDGK